MMVRIFELLFTLSESEYAKLMNKCQHGQNICPSYRIYRIGTIVDGDGIEVVWSDGQITKVYPAGFDHL